MNYFTQYIILSIIQGLLFNLVQSRYIAQNDDYYLLYVDNNYGQLYQKRQEPREFISSLVMEIHELIVENKETYKNPEELEALDEQEHPLKKRDEIYDSNYVYPISSIKDTTVLLTYLSYDLNEKVKALPGIRGSEPNKEIPIDTAIDVNDIEIDFNEMYKRSDNDIVNDDALITEIKLETGWKDVEIRRKSYSNLSLISQNLYNDTSNPYDATYYYPKSAGEGIDIYIVDSGFNFGVREYDNKEEREAKCIGTMSNSLLEKPTSEDSCVSNSNHGEKVANSVGGARYGTASKANIYGIALEMNQKGDYTKASFISALDYITNTLSVRPYKTIVNLSVGDYVSLDETEYINTIKEIVDQMNEQGIIIVTAAGNGVTVKDSNGKKKVQGVNVYDLNRNKVLIPCIFDNVICVGGIDNFGYNDANPSLSLQSASTMNPKNYRRIYFSNYGEKVDLYAPGCGIIEEQRSNLSYYFSMFCGTSISSPITAGVIATIMSEYSHIQYNTLTMLEYLRDLGQKDIIEGIPEGPNIFLNNGKYSVYNNNSVKNNVITTTTTSTTTTTTTTFETVNSTSIEIVDPTTTEILYSTSIVENTTSTITITPTTTEIIYPTTQTEIINAAFDDENINPIEVMNTSLTEIVYPTTTENIYATQTEVVNATYTTTYTTLQEETTLSYDNANTNENDEAEIVTSTEEESYTTETETETETPTEMDISYDDEDDDTTENIDVYEEDIHTDDDSDTDEEY